MRSLTSTHNDVATGQTRPKPHRAGARCQYVAMPHPQHPTVLVRDIDIPSHSAGGCSKELRPQTHRPADPLGREQARPGRDRRQPLIEQVPSALADRLRLRHRQQCEHPPAGRDKALSRTAGQMGG